MHGRLTRHLYIRDGSKELFVECLRSFLSSLFVRPLSSVNVMCLVLVVVNRLHRSNQHRYIGFVVLYTRTVSTNSSRSNP